MLSNGILTVGHRPGQMPGWFRESQGPHDPTEATGGSKDVSDPPAMGGGGATAPPGIPLCPAWLTGHAPSQACRDFLELAETHSRKWQRALQYEQEQRVHLEETIEQLAKQHNSLERAFRTAPGRATNPTKSFSEGEWASVHPSSPPSVSPLPAGSAYTAPPGYIPLNAPTSGPAWPALVPVCLCIPHALTVGTVSPCLVSQSPEKSSVSPTVPSVAGLPGCQVAAHLTWGSGSRVPWEGGPSEREAGPQRD